MIGVVVVSHGRLADEFVAATEHVVGPMDALLAVCIGPDDDMEKRRADIREAIADADRGEGVLVLTDMFGGTPSNLAISLLDPGKVEVIAGVNLPMLIKLAEARSRADLDSLARMGEDAGKRYIAIASNVLEGAGK
ncbi:MULTISPECIES: PTS sugar transporter subunit IIA [Maricaulis]|jgi:PTS system mannose-specific IIA component|uniref:PTS fructose transporter subunit IIA n=1 Tax=Maricaulis virginensis TaxID=144022 RepID=A0A9W6MNZ4_9PROT|nr:MULTISPECIES: PTS sugar transporter subunit IIA [Maricaulis]MAC39860.1 PTS fructose transporter subunit IIA [Oceanicaulis sp.]MED5550609.1 PTS sugar transporter subunit IIA [Pseudomonadota bacterium]MAZ90626.1 PTS fructose transporter subunit IIA [Maricaulis sp.]MBO6765500.1 PTS sugar transporter subunit IIA [Maricaulis sp.]GLK53125.1 PTS fructose transporter subunit IIA [Maricaulis virginensis]|tara:strand:+ start:150 stop:557 length:408 start_codon:yes stop_codon:yes gene_type:complete